MCFTKKNYPIISVKWCTIIKTLQCVGLWGSLEAPNKPDSLYILNVRDCCKQIANGDVLLHINNKKWQSENIEWYQKLYHLKIVTLWRDFWCRTYFKYIFKVYRWGLGIKIYISFTTIDFSTLNSNLFEKFLNFTIKNFFHFSIV